MLVFIRMLPESTTVADLDQLVDRAIDRPWPNFFRHRGSYEKPQILKITDRDRMSIEYHGLVEIEPADAALGAIKRLGNTRLHGSQLEVRRYFRRSPYLDRRGQMPGREELNFLDRRVSDRRRPGLMIEQVDIAGETQAAI